MSLFYADDVKFSSRNKQIINGITLSVERGSVIGLLGQSGSGKSTLLKLLSGILVPSAGKILYDGIDIQLMSNVQNKMFRRKCSFVFQDSALWANQDIQQNLNLPLQTHNPLMSQKDRLDAIHEICNIVGYTRPLNLRPVDLSAGEQKKVAFARALINKPDVLFLDECTESLDRKGTALIIKLLLDFKEKGNTIIYVSHNSTFISEMQGTLYEIEDGFLKTEGKDEI